TEAGGTKRDLERAPSSLGRTEDDVVFASLANVGAAAAVNRNRLEGLNSSDTAFNVVQRHPGKHSVGPLSLSNSLSPTLSASLCLGHSLPPNVRGSLSTMFEINFKFQTKLLNLPAPCHVRFRQLFH
ncbi:hypothetical protein VIGAN_11084400, partial [Vigna angularis var. angularis]